MQQPIIQPLCYLLREITVQSQKTLKATMDGIVPSVYGATMPDVPDPARAESQSQSYTPRPLTESSFKGMLNTVNGPKPPQQIPSIPPPPLLWASGSYSIPFRADVYLDHSKKNSQMPA